MDIFAYMVPLMGMVLTCLTIVALFYIRAMNERTKTTARADVQNRLIERFANSSEFVTFVQSPEGQQFLSAPHKEPIRERGLGSMKWGVFFGTIGLGFMLLGFMFEEEFGIPGIILLSLGVGMFLSGLLANRFARSSRPAENASQQI